MTERVKSGLTWRGLETDFTVRLVRHRQTKETVTDRLHLRDTAPVLDPTPLRSSVILTFSWHGPFVFSILEPFITQ